MYRKNPSKIASKKNYASLFANWPQAASISLPRLLRTFTMMPIFCNSVIYKLVASSDAC
jgi:hypothetical protein